MPHPNEENAILGKGSKFEGKLTFEGTVRIGGEFKGEIKSQDTLIIGEGASVEAEVDVAKLVLSGRLKGNVKAAKQIQLLPPAKLYGTIQTPSLIIGEGVIFEGTCKMENVAPAEDKPRAADKPADKPREEPAKPAPKPEQKPEERKEGGVKP